MTIPVPTAIYRLIHIDNLRVCLSRDGLNAPNHAPNDGLVYRTIHNVDIQRERGVRPVPCGPGGTVHDYVPFYFGYLSPMMLQLKTGQVEGYTEGQEPLIYLVSTAQTIQASGTRFVFSDGHGIAKYTAWYDDLGRLDAVDWSMVYQRYWQDTVGDMDRQRRKQAEFLAHRFCQWNLIREIGVIDPARKRQVEAILTEFPERDVPAVSTHRDWYYY